MGQGAQRVAIVTGGLTGIGLAAAKALADQGHHVAIGSRQADNIHAIEKAKLVEENLGGDTRPVDNIFPLEAPYCDVDLTPRWDYDLQKATFLNCNEEVGKHDKKGLAVGLGVGLGLVVLSLLVALFHMHQRGKKLEKEIDTLLNKDAIEA